MLVNNIQVNFENDFTVDGGRLKGTARLQANVPVIEDFLPTPIQIGIFINGVPHFWLSNCGKKEGCGAHKFEKGFKYDLSHFGIAITATQPESNLEFIVGLPDYGVLLKRHIAREFNTFFKLSVTSIWSKPS